VSYQHIGTLHYVSSRKWKRSQIAGDIHTTSTHIEVIFGERASQPVSTVSTVIFARLAHSRPRISLRCAERMRSHIPALASMPGAALVGVGSRSLCFPYRHLSPSLSFLTYLSFDTRLSSPYFLLQALLKNIKV
jgi:hypothetical protein